MIQIPEELIQPPGALPAGIADIWIGVVLTLFILDRAFHLFKSYQKKANTPNPTPEMKTAEIHRAIMGDGITPGMHKLLVEIRDLIKREQEQ